MNLSRQDTKQIHPSYSFNNRVTNVKKKKKKKNQQISTEVESIKFKLKIGYTFMNTSKQSQRRLQTMIL